MSDIRLSGDNDLFVANGQIYLIGTTEELTRQKILNKLRSFTNTLFTDINYGIRDTLVFQYGTQSLLDQEIKSLIQSTRGVIELQSYTSTVSSDRVYLADFIYKVETGELVNIKDLPVSSSITDQIPRLGIWEGGVWNYVDLWDNAETWGGVTTTPPNALTYNGNTITYNGEYLTYT